MPKDYSKMSKEELIAELKRQKPKKYGLVWEEKTEDVVDECKTKLPVLNEVTKRAIEKAPGEPTNIIIEGDNYHALSVLNYTHQGKIDVIYIDPPYNTGNKDFIYNDKFVDKEDTFRHSKWLSFMEKRLVLAKNLLSQSGVIFISIDDNEQAALKLLCDEIFGNDNFIAAIVWQKKYSASNDASGIPAMHDYIFVYSRSDKFKRNLLPRTEKQDFAYKNDDKDGRGLWRSDNLLVKSFSKSGVFEIVNPNTGKKYLPKEGNSWRASKETVLKWLKEGRIFFGKDGKGAPQLKRYLGEVQQGIVPVTWWTYDDGGHNDQANKELQMFFGSKRVPFDTPKPTKLITKLLQIGIGKKGHILDFFAGSGTTGHAVMKLNQEDGGKRQFILCTNNENKIAEEVTYPRIKKVITGYANEKGIPANVRYFKTDFVNKTASRDEQKMKITERCTEMLCLREGIYTEVIDKKSYKIFKEGERILAVYYAVSHKDLPKLQKELEKMKGDKILYCFTLDTDELDAKEFADWTGVHLEPIPQKILDIYKEIHEY